MKNASVNIVTAAREAANRVVNAELYVARLVESTVVKRSCDQCCSGVCGSDERGGIKRSGGECCRGKRGSDQANSAAATMTAAGLTVGNECCSIKRGCSKRGGYKRCSD